MAKRLPVCLAHRYRGFSKYTILSKMLSTKVFEMKIAWGNVLLNPFTSMFNCFSLSFHITPIPSKWHFLNLAWILSVISCWLLQLPEVISDFAKGCSAPGFSDCSQRTRYKKSSWQSPVGWLENRCSFLGCFIVYRSVDAFLSFVSKSRYTLSWYVNNDNVARCSQSLSPYIF